MSVDMPKHDGDLYVNDGETFDNGEYYPDAPEERKTEEREAAAAVASSYPVMAEIAEWFKEQILACDDIHNIQATEIVRDGVTYSRKVSIEAQVLAFQLIKDKMQSKFDEYKEFIKESDS